MIQPFQIEMMKKMSLDMIFKLYLVSLKMHDMDTADYILEHYHHLFTEEQQAEAGALVEKIVKEMEGH